ncbi:MAG TPA: hypothetical protein VFR18_09300 [Terriglobia bacterium]|nr:hypothetical protein [Terriglobia bacterium]
MVVPPIFAALMQEVGFDIVSYWNQSGYLLIAVSIVVLAAVVLIAFEILRNTSGKRRD